MPNLLFLYTVDLKNNISFLTCSYLVTDELVLVSDSAVPINSVNVLHELPSLPLGDLYTLLAASCTH